MATLIKTEFQTYSWQHDKLFLRRAAVLSSEIMERIRKEEKGNPPWPVVRKWCIENCIGKFDDDAICNIRGIDINWWWNSNDDNWEVLYKKHPELREYHILFSESTLNFELEDDAEHFLWCLG